MPRIRSETVKHAQDVLQKMNVFSFDQVLALLKCSIRSGRSQLTQWGTYSSYNHNGRYYTMPSVPRFDEHGVWRCHDLSFSRYGTLKKTILHLVSESLAGLTGKQLGLLLGRSPHNFLHHFRDLPELSRRKHGGVYVYFSSTPARYAIQAHNRVERERLTEPGLCTTDAVMLLVAMLKQHRCDIDTLMGLPEMRSSTCSAGDVRQFLQCHGLLKKR